MFCCQNAGCLDSLRRRAPAELIIRPKLFDDATSRNHAALNTILSDHEKVRRSLTTLALMVSSRYDRRRLFSEALELVWIEFHVFGSHETALPSLAVGSPLRQNGLNLLLRRSMLPSISSHFVILKINNKFLNY